MSVCAAATRLLSCCTAMYRALLAKEVALLKSKTSPQTVPLQQQLVCSSACQQQDGLWQQQRRRRQHQDNQQVLEQLHHLPQQQLLQQQQQSMLMQASCLSNQQRQPQSYMRLLQQLQQTHALCYSNVAAAMQSGMATSASAEAINSNMGRNVHPLQQQQQQVQALQPYQQQALAATLLQLSAANQRMLLHLPPTADINPIITQLVSQYYNTLRILILASSTTRVFALKAALQPVLGPSGINPRVVPGELIKPQHTVLLVDLQQFQKMPSVTLQLLQQQTAHRAVAIYEEGFVSYPGVYDSVPAVPKPQQQQGSMADDGPATAGRTPYNCYVKRGSEDSLAASSSSHDSGNNSSSALLSDSTRAVAQSILRQLRHLEPNPDRLLITISSRGWQSGLVQQHSQHQHSQPVQQRQLQSTEQHAATELNTTANGFCSSSGSSNLPIVPQLPGLQLPVFRLSGRDAVAAGLIRPAAAISILTNTQLPVEYIQAADQQTAAAAAAEGGGGSGGAAVQPDAGEPTNATAAAAHNPTAQHASSSSNSSSSSAADITGPTAVEQLGCLLATEDRHSLIAVAYKAAAAGGKAVAYTLGQDHTRQLGVALNLKGISSLVLHEGQTPDEQTTVLQAFNSASDRVLVSSVNCIAAVTAGLQCDVGCILMAAPTLDQQQYAARLGPCLLPVLGVYPPSTAAAVAVDSRGDSAASETQQQQFDYSGSGSGSSNSGGQLAACTVVDFVDRVVLPGNALQATTAAAAAAAAAAATDAVAVAARCAQASVLPTPPAAAAAGSSPPRTRKRLRRAAVSAAGGNADSLAASETAAAAAAGAAATAASPAVAAAPRRQVLVICRDVLDPLVCRQLPLPHSLASFLPSGSISGSSSSLKDASISQSSDSGNSSSSAVKQRPARKSRAVTEHSPKSYDSHLAVTGDLIWTILDNGSWAIPLQRGRGANLAGLKLLWLTKVQGGWIPQVEEGLGQMNPVPGTTGRPTRLQRARLLSEAWLKAHHPSEATLRELGTPWRDNPMSEAQVMFCERHHIPYHPAWARGMVNNTIDRYIVEEMRVPATELQLFLLRHFAPYAPMHLKFRGGSTMTYRQSANSMLKTLLTADWGRSSAQGSLNPSSTSTTEPFRVLGNGDRGIDPSEVLPARKALMEDLVVQFDAGLRPAYTWMLITGKDLVLDLMSGVYMWLRRVDMPGVAELTAGSVGATNSSMLADVPSGAADASSMYITKTSSSSSSSADNSSTSASSSSRSSNNVTQPVTPNALDADALYELTLQLPDGLHQPIATAPAAAAILAATAAATIAPSTATAAAAKVSTGTPAASGSSSSSSGLTSSGSRGFKSRPLPLAAAVERAERIAASLASQGHAFLSREALVRLAGMIGGWKVQAKSTEQQMAMPASTRQLELLRAAGLPQSRRYSCLDAHRELTRHCKTLNLPEPSATPSQIARIQELHLPLSPEILASLTAAEAKALLFRVQLAEEARAAAAAVEAAATMGGNRKATAVARRNAVGRKRVY